MSWETSEMYTDPFAWLRTVLGDTAYEGLIAAYPTMSTWQADLLCRALIADAHRIRDRSRQLDEAVNAITHMSSPRRAGKTDLMEGINAYLKARQEASEQRARDPRALVAALDGAFPTWRLIAGSTLNVASGSKEGTA